MGAKNNDSHSQKQAIVKFYTMEYRKCDNFNSKNDSRPYMGASAFLKSIDFRTFTVNVKAMIRFCLAILYGTSRPPELSVHFWRVMIFPERQSFRSVPLIAAVSVSVRIICRIYVRISQNGRKKKDLKPQHQKKK